MRGHRYAVLLGLGLLLAACGPSARPADSAVAGRAASAPAEPVSAAVAPTAATPSLRPTEAPLDPPTTVRAGLVGAVPNAGIYVAQERGYFREQGIEVEVTEFESATPLVPLLASGQVDVGG